MNVIHCKAVNQLFNNKGKAKPERYIDVVLFGKLKSWLARRYFVVTPVQKPEVPEGKVYTKCQM